MCGEQEPANVADALAMLDRALAALAAADAGALPTAFQARALRALERAEARHTAARARMLAAFGAQDGYEDDGHGSARVWLKWQTRVTGTAAVTAVGWAPPAGRPPGDRPGAGRRADLHLMGEGDLRLE